MDRSPSQQPSASRFVSRTEIRRAVHDVVRRALLLRLSRRRRGQPRAHERDRRRPPPRLTKAQRSRIIHHANVIEDVLYRRASSLEEYQDRATLERRVFEAGEMVRHINARRREAAEARRRIRAAAATRTTG
ncbi:hypothetical protein ACHAWF_010051 [Thalassiosira exigua]